MFTNEDQRTQKADEKEEDEDLEEEEEEEAEAEEETEEEEEKVDLRNFAATKGEASLDDTSGRYGTVPEMCEAEMAILAAKKRQAEGAEAALQDYEELRKAEREKEKEEFRNLKEKKELRRQEREEFEREMIERRRLDEERHQQEEEERRLKIEAEKRKKEEEKKKRQQFHTSNFANIGQQGGRNFIIPKKSDDNAADKFGNIVQAKHEMGMTKEQQEQAKRSYLEMVQKVLDFFGLTDSDLREKIKQFHQCICKLEASKYDLEKRHERQEYDLRELNERQRLVARNKAKSKGLDPDSANSQFPQKIAVFSKYDRQIDRRSFTERRAVYDKRDAYPCFPNVPPPAVDYEQLSQVAQAATYNNRGEEAETDDEE